MNFNIQTGEELFQTLLLLVLSLMVIILLIAVVNIYYMAKKVLNQKLGIVEETSTTSIWDRLNALKPMKEEAALTLDHDYDGIKELDNHLPPWWLGMFYAGIVFGIIYLLNYHVWQWSPLQDEEYQIAMQVAQEEKSKNLANQENAIDESNVALVTEAAKLSEAESIFIGNCAACHGKLGEGGVGPNLTDEYWLHGGSVADIFKSIKYGIPEKGMIAWESSLSPMQMQSVSSYIYNLKGTNPPNGKAPQGEKYQEAATQDTTSEEIALK